MQNRTLEIAKQASLHEWTTEHADSQKTLAVAFESLSDGSAKIQEQLLAALMTAFNAASFGHCDGHFESACGEPDHERLGVEEFVDGEVEEAIKQGVIKLERISSSPAFEQLYLGYFHQSPVSATCIDRSGNAPPGEFNYVSVFLLNDIDVHLRKHRIIAFLAKICKFVTQDTRLRSSNATM